nr:unnamed protein product [Digitaria exilis]
MGVNVMACLTEFMKAGSRAVAWQTHELSRPIRRRQHAVSRGSSSPPSLCRCWCWCWCRCRDDRLLPPLPLSSSSSSLLRFGH